MDLRSDFSGYIELTVPEPTADGRRSFTIHSGHIDDDAESYFGRGYCHWLAGAIHSITGWPVVTVDVRLTGYANWRPVHSGVLTPNGTVLDIFGDNTRQTVCARHLEPVVAETRSRIVAGPNVPGDVLSGIDHLRGNHLWWTHQYCTPELQALLLHFARLVLTRHGYGHHIPAAARSRRTDTTAAPQRQPPTDHPTPRGSAMSIPEEVAQLNAIASAIPVGLLQQLADAEVPAEVLAAREALSGGSGGVVAILGRTGEATEAADGISHAIAKLDRAAEAYQAVRNQLSDAFKSAARAQQLIQQAADYHGRGQK